MLRGLGVNLSGDVMALVCGDCGDALGIKDLVTSWIQHIIK